jgi:hypothetical protein
VTARGKATRKIHAIWDLHPEAFNASLYVAPQFGWAWWDGGAKRVMFSVGVMSGYINTEATGKGIVLGIQPGLVAQF